MATTSGSILDFKQQHSESENHSQNTAKTKKFPEVEPYLQQIKSLENERTSWEGVWREVRDNISPEVAAALTDAAGINNGRDRQGKVMTSSPQLAVEALAAGMQGGLVSPARMWFALGVKGKAGYLSTGAKQWLDAVRDVLLYYFNEADIYGAMHQLFSEMALFGQGVVLIEEDERTGFRFTTLSCGDYWLDSNHKDEVDTLMRKAYYSARGLIEKYGELHLPEIILNEAKKKTSIEKKYEVVHIIQPRQKRDMTRGNAKNMPWESIHILRTGGSTDNSGKSTILKIGGFKSKPFVAPRWKKLAGRVYGSCPARIALPDIKTLYQIIKEGLNGLKKSVSPPVTASGQMKQTQIRLIPNGVTYLKGMNQNSQVAPIYQTTGALNEAFAERDRLVQLINDVFYVNLFAPIMNRDKSMSATEVTSVNAEKMGQITPVIELLEKEALDYIFVRCFNILLNIGGIIPPAPPELQGIDLKIDYVSVLAQAQRMSEINGVIQFLSSIAPAVQMNMESMDVVDMDKVVRKIGEVLCQQNLLRDTKEVAKLRKNRAKAMQEQAAAAQTKEAISSVKEASETDVNTLGQLLGIDMGAA